MTTGSEQAIQSRLEILAKLKDVPTRDASGNPIVKSIVKEWLLVTYDIPATDAGHRARREFLKKVKWAGGVQHTESVYLIPATPLADLAALDAASAGKSYIFLSSTSEAVTEKLTEEYDAKVGEYFSEVEKRIASIMSHVLDKHYKLAENMVEKTIPMLQGLELASVQRGSLDMYDRWKKLVKDFQLARGLATTLS